MSKLDVQSWALKLLACEPVFCCASASYKLTLGQLRMGWFIPSFTLGLNSWNARDEKVPKLLSGLPPKSDC
jgi:hypothetical protein